MHLLDEMTFIETYFFLHLCLCNFTRITSSSHEVYGFEGKVLSLQILGKKLEPTFSKITIVVPASDSGGAIPGFGVDPADLAVDKPVPKKKVPYAKPIPKNFEQAWESGAQPNMLGGADANTKPKGRKEHSA